MHSWDYPRKRDILAAIRGSIGTLLGTIGERGNCLKRSVGVAVFYNGQLVASAANGTAEGLPRCDEGGCARCKSKQPRVHGTGYDLCVCLHAEEAAVAYCNSHGLSLRGTTIVSSYQPCLMCAKLLTACQVEGVRYIDPWQVPELGSGVVGLKDDYLRVLSRFPDGCVTIPDNLPADSAWS
jgi:dCMP deaminase